MEAQNARLGREFGWLWFAYVSSTVGTWLGFGALPLIAIQVLDVSTFQVSMLAAAGLAVGAVIAVPLGGKVEFLRKRPVMIMTDLVRFCALICIPVAFAMGWLTFTLLLLVSIVVVAADIAFVAASGAYLKHLLKPSQLLVANGRFESTTWVATAVGPPLGGGAIGMLGPVVTVIANAGSFLVSAVGLFAIRGQEVRPDRRDEPTPNLKAMFDGWKFILADSDLRPLFFNTVLVNALIMATEPLLVVLLVGELGFSPWQYGLAFGLPCLGGLIGARLAPRLVARYGRRRVMTISGVLRACWPVGLVFVAPGVGGLVVVIAVEFLLIACMGVFNPIFATYRLQRVATDRVARILTAWSVTNKAVIALLTAGWGVVAVFTGTHAAIVISGVLLLVTPILLVRSPSEPRRLPGEKETQDATPR